MTGSDWEITKEVDTNYFYYKGRFNSGKIMEDDNTISEENLTIERIKEIINGMKVECELKRYISTMM